MRKIKIHIFDKCYHKKPQKKEMGMISQAIVRRHFKRSGDCIVAAN